MTFPREFFFGDWQNKLIALGVACVLWWVVSDMTDGVSEPIAVPVRFVLEPPQFMVLSPGEPVVRIRISGPKGIVNDLVYQAGEIRARHTIRVDPAILELREAIMPGDVRVPPGVSVEILDEPIPLRLARRVPGRLRVKPVLVGVPAAGFEVEYPVKTTPSELSLEAPSTLFERTDGLPTEPIDVGGLSASFSLDQPLVPALDGVPVGYEGLVRVQVDIRPVLAVRELAQVPVHVLAPPGYPFRVRFPGGGSEVTIKLRGPEAQVQSLAREELKAWVDVSQDQPREVPYQRTPQVTLPKGLELLEATEVRYEVERP